MAKHKGRLERLKKAVTTVEPVEIVVVWDDTELREVRARGTDVVEISWDDIMEPPAREM